MKTIRTIVLFSFYLLVLIPPANGQPKQKTPLEGLESIPFPPKTIQEALRRCPGDRDTLVHSLAEDLDYYVGEKEIELGKHVDNPFHTFDGKPWTRRMKEGYQRAQEKLRKEIQNNERDIPRLLANIADSSARRLLEDVRMIGEELDSKIKTCQAGKSGYDTLCVERAETGALEKRQDASSDFLRDVNLSWSGLLDSLKTIMTKRLELAREVSVTESKKQTIQLWKIVRKVLETEEHITKLAVQFSR